MSAFTCYEVALSTHSRRWAQLPKTVIDSYHSCLLPKNVAIEGMACADS